jgi:hypothetical protein
MKLLLVVGLAAVVIVILIAVFLSVRLGRGDDHEEQVRPGSRDRGRRDDEDSRWRDADARDARLVTAASRTGGSGRRARDEADISHHQDRAGRRPSREQAARGQDGDYGYPDHPDTGPPEHPSSPRRAAARNGRASGREYRDRPADGRRDQRGAGQPDYQTGPQRGYAESGHLSGPLPVPDFPSGEYPSADYPSMDFPSGPLASAGYPSGDYPAAPASGHPGGRSRSKSGPGKNGSSRPQPESRRKPAKKQSPAKGRSRSRRDDDDWPSTEWDKLTDEQYWAELSSDKPLSTSARTAQAPSEPAAGNGRSRSANGKPAADHGAPPPMPPAEPGRELPSRKAASPPREPATERLPVRARPQPPVPARVANGSPITSRADASLPQPAEEPSLAMLSSLAGSAPARPYGALDEDPLTSPSFSRPALDSRSYHRAGAPPAGSGAHRRPAASPASASYDTGGRGTASYRPDGYQVGMGHPSLPYPAGDYSGSGPYSAPPASPSADGDQPPGPAGPGYTYPAVRPSPAAPASWHGAPDEPIPAQGNPYGSYVNPAPPSHQASPAMYADAHPSGGHAYPADSARGYAGPGFSHAPAPYQPAIAAAGHAADARHYPAAGSYSQTGYPSDGGYGYEQHASQSVYPAPREAASYPPGYASGYPGAPYENNGYGYPAEQG